MFVNSLGIFTPWRKISGRNRNHRDIAAIRHVNSNGKKCLVTKRAWCPILVCSAFIDWKLRARSARQQQMRNRKRKNKLANRQVILSFEMTLFSIVSFEYTVVYTMLYIQRARLGCCELMIINWAYCLFHLFSILVHIYNL